MQIHQTQSIQQQNVRFYDEEALRYDTIRYSDPKGRRLDAFHKRLLQSVLIDKLKPESRVLELGCGTGRLLSHISVRISSPIGIDASHGMLAAGLRLHADGLRLVHGDVHTLPFADQSLDATYAILVLNLIPDLSSVLREVRRVLRPGGLLLFNMPNLASVYFPGGLYVNLRGHTVRRNRAGYRYSRWYSRRQISNALASTGFGVCEIWGQPPHVTRLADVQPWPGDRIHAWACKSLYYLAQKPTT